ncbi:hypothetical protein BB427_03285 [Pseudoalteromonas sp. BMB]|uniref:hypothetical protein n=1 Tax=Pseudoalteromonas sp. BMB TaxID=1874619 RepID=UPI00083D3A3F|nr:hypothetical protein [Pseudoalteromonas sp. BMB]ODB34759.1 hypothetical protein BB427_03285 [Pseudoalteromonas sp. BMB]
MRTINFNWNNHIKLDADVLPELKPLKGKVWEFLIPDIDTDYRVFKSFHDNRYYIFNGNNVVSILTFYGRILRFRSLEPTLNKVVVGKEYNNLLDGTLKVSFSGSDFFVGERLVGNIGSENRLSWAVKCLLKFKLLAYNPWNGIRYDETIIDQGLALTLLISEVASLDS